MTFIKSPLNYTGGKYKLLPQIIPLFPKKIDTFWDMFGGGFNIGINVTANEVVYVDTNREITNMLYWFSHKPFERVLSDIDNLITQYNLDKENEEGYLKSDEFSFFVIDENKLWFIEGRLYLYEVNN